MGYLLKLSKLKSLALGIFILILNIHARFYGYLL
jgi:hypothetical protein